MGCRLSGAAGQRTFLRSPVERGFESTLRRRRVAWGTGPGVRPMRITFPRVACAATLGGRQDVLLGCRSRARSASAAHDRSEERRVAKGRTDKEVAMH